MKTFKNTFADFSFQTCYITDSLEAEKICKKLCETKRLLGLDIETAKLTVFKEHARAGLDPALSKVRLLQIYHDGEARVYVFDLFKIPISAVVPLLRDGKFCSHNAIFELSHLGKFISTPVNIGCSMILSQLVDGAEHSAAEPRDDDEESDGMNKYRVRGHGLDAVTQRLLGFKVEKFSQLSDWSEELSTEQIIYAALDAVLTYKCAKILEQKLIDYKMVKIYHLLKEMQHVVVGMESEGLPVDWDYHAQLVRGWVEKSINALVSCKPYFGTVNIQSGKQLGNWLKEYLVDKPLELAAWPRTVQGAYAFSKTAITGFSHLPAIAALLEYKKYTKLLNTYGESLTSHKHPITGRLHTSYTLGQTRTGRLSSRAPNCQNFPHDPEFRRMFATDSEHVIVAADFSQIELRLQAEFSKDPVMCETFKKGQDIYKITASSFLGTPVEKITDAQRTIGKILSLSLGFGMGPTKLGLYALNGFGLKKPQSEWDRAHKTYHKLFNVYSKWCDKMRDRAAKLGYIETLMGRRRKLTEEELYTRAPNTVIQGTAAELMMKAMLICQSRLDGAGRIIGTVHDEILVHCKTENAMQVKTCLESSMCDSMKEMFPNAASFDVAKVKIGSNWAEAK